MYLCFFDWKSFKCIFFSQFPFFYFTFNFETKFVQLNILFVMIINLTRWSSNLSLSKLFQIFLPGSLAVEDHLRSILGIIFCLGINCRQGSFAVLYRSRRAQFIYYRNYNRIRLQLRGHSPSRIPVKKLRCLLQKRTKVRVFLWKGIRKNIISYYSSAFTINRQPRRLV